MKKAFTMLELVFVIVVIGIIAATVLPRTSSNAVAEASTQLISHIRYAQHLGMVDDKFNSTTGSNWYRNVWQISFSGNTYSIVGDGGTFAKNPQNQKPMQNIDLADDYSVSIALGGGCTGETELSFDYLGRPLVGDLNTSTSPVSELLPYNTPCTITVTNGTDTGVITIRPETGYASLAL